MTEALGVVLVVTWFAGGLIIPVYGGIISRKAYREHGWAEARLASYAFFGMIVTLILGSLAWPIVAWLSGEVVSSAALYATSVFWEIGSFLANAALALALYRFSIRVARFEQRPGHGPFAHRRAYPVAPAPRSEGVASTDRRSF